MIPHQEESGLLGEVADSKSKAEKGGGERSGQEEGKEWSKGNTLL